MKHKKKLFLDIIPPILWILIAESIIFYGYILPALGIYVLNALLIILMIIFGDISLDTKYVRQNILLLLLLRITNLSMPQFFTATLQWYPLIYGVMYVPIYNLIEYQKISSAELGINFKKLYIYLPLSVLIGYFAALGEYRILKPTALIASLQLSNILLITIIMFAFIGTVEELIFRSIIQTGFEKLFGLAYGLLLTSLIFGIMHFSYGIKEVTFTFGFGLILGKLFQKTRSLPFIVSIHGVENVLLFGIFPLMPSIVR